MGQALLATSYDGRPIKVDGNPDHPWSLGAASSQMQASVLDLWNVDRSQSVVRREGRTSASPPPGTISPPSPAEHFEQLSPARRGRGLAVLTGASSSPSRARLRDEMQRRFPEMQWFEHEPVGDRARIGGAERAFGAPLRDVPHLEKARIIADFDADLLHRPSGRACATPACSPAAAGATPARRMSRVYVFETRPSATPACVADHRVPVARTQIAAALAALAAELVEHHRVSLPAGLRHHAPPTWPPTAAKSHAHGRGWRPWPSDLAAHRGDGLISVGDRQPAGAHHLAHVLNVALGQPRPDRHLRSRPPRPGSPTSASRW